MLFEKFVQMSSLPGKTRSDLCCLLRPQVQVIASVSGREVPRNAHAVDVNNQVHVAFKHINLEEGSEAIKTAYLTYSPEFIADPQGFGFTWLRKIRAVIAWTHSDMEILVHMLQRCASGDAGQTKFTSSLSRFVRSLQRQPNQDDPDRAIVSSISGLIRALYANEVSRYVTHVSGAYLPKAEMSEIRGILDSLFGTGPFHRVQPSGSSYPTQRVRPHSEQSAVHLSPRHRIAPPRRARSSSDSLRDRKRRSGPKSEPIGVSNRRVFSARNERDQIFICYSHNDKKYFAKFKSYLEPYIKDNLLDVWSDERLKPGEDWNAEINNALARAKIGVCLTSLQFFTSKFIKSVELPGLLTAARDGGAKIFWVACEPYNYEQTIFWPIHCANDPKQPLNTLPNPKRQQVLVRITAMLYKEFTAN